MEQEGGLRASITNILLAVIAVLLMIIAVAVSRKDISDRYVFQINGQSGELYVFDKQSGDVFMTSPQMIGTYAEEVWTKLNPGAGKALSFKEFLQHKAGSDLRKKFIEEKKRVEAEPLSSQEAR
jgi:hypothetical protein